MKQVVTFAAALVAGFFGASLARKLRASASRPSRKWFFAPAVSNWSTRRAMRSRIGAWIRVKIWSWPSEVTGPRRCLDNPPILPVTPSRLTIPKTNVP